ncbi:uncharacterized protein [Procambarus clarkii]|uniref:uncharacterized protein n=1 Tax=Procambarus clarkii TaxID=6728 RepID=UPI003742F4A2
MLWPVHSVTALALFTCASWADLNGAGHLGFHQSLTSIHDDVTKRQPIAVRSARGARYRFGGNVASGSLSKGKDSAGHKGLPKVTTQFYNVTEVTTRVNGATEVIDPLSDTTQVSPQADDVTEVSSQADDFTEISPQADDFTEISPQADDFTEVSPQADDFTEVSSQADDFTEISPQADDFTEISPQADDFTEVSPQADDFTEVSPQADDFTEVSPQADDFTKISPQADDFTKISPQADDFTEISPQADDFTEISPQADDFTEISPQADDFTEVSPQADDFTEVSSQADDFTEISPQADDFTEISPQADDFTEVSLQADDFTEVRTMPIDVTEVTINFDAVMETTGQLNDVTLSSISSIEETSLNTGETSTSRPTLTKDVTEDNIQSHNADHIRQINDIEDVSNGLDDVSAVTNEHDDVIDVTRVHDVTAINTHRNDITETRSQHGGANEVDAHPNDIEASDITRSNIGEFVYIRESEGQASAGTLTQASDVLDSGLHSGPLTHSTAHPGNWKQSSATEVVARGNGTTEVVARGNGTTEEVAGGHGRTEVVARDNGTTEEVGGGHGTTEEVAGGHGTTEEVAGGHGRTEVVARDNGTTEEVGGGHGTTEEVAGGHGTTEEVGGGHGTTEEVAGGHGTGEVVARGNGTRKVSTAGEATEERVPAGGETREGVRASKTSIRIKDTAGRGRKTADRALKTTPKGPSTERPTSTVITTLTTGTAADDDTTEAATDDDTTEAATDDDTTEAATDDDTTEAATDDDTTEAATDDDTTEAGITLDEHGFVVSLWEEEKVDQEDDLRIYEAVVTSMAQWELHKLSKMNRKRVRRDEEVVCYPDLGCFRDEGPFDYLDMLPSPPEEINTRFLLYTRERGEREKVIKPHNISTIVNSHFNISRPTKLLIHGFGSSCNSVWIREMRVALLTMMDVNIICVNWQKGAEVPNYVRAASNTRLVGRQVALLLETMIANLNTTLDDFHLIGFSLGAHVSGHAGARLKNLSRISGLDPAGPLFESYSPSVRLDYTDARFVDVIHTNADSLLMGGLGAFEPMGHVDFYPNGGRMQKGCANLFVGGVSDILWPTEGDGRYLCNHRRGYKYYLNSVAPICTFPAFVCRDYETFLKGDCFPCESCGNMGYFSDKAEGRGQLYLVTRDTEPFCANQYKVAVHHSGGPPADPVTTYGRLDITFIAADGINETLQISQSEDTVMEAGLTTVRILVPHPAITDIHAIQLRYTAYHGWIYSGFNRWAIDKISLMDSFGKMLSFCHRGTTLISGKAMHLTLLPGDCQVRDAPSLLPVGPLHLPHPHIQETENEVHEVSSLQLGVTAHKEPPHNASLPHRPFNLTHHVPPPTLSPTDPHDSVITPHQPPTFVSNSQVSSNRKEVPHGFYNASRLRPPHAIMPNKLPSNLPGKIPIKAPPSRYGAGGSVGTSPVAAAAGTRPGDVAMSSEEPVSVIPAPDLAHLPSPHNFSQGLGVYKHGSGQVPSTPGSAHTPGTVQTPVSVQTTISVYTPVYLHSTTPVPVSGDLNHTQNHSVVMTGARPIIEDSLTVPTSPAIALLPPDPLIVSAITLPNRNSINKTFSMQVTIVSPNITLHSNISSLASNIKTLDRDDNQADSLLGSTRSPVTPKGSTQLPLSTLVMPDSQHRQPGFSSPLPAAAGTTTTRPQWSSITRFSGDHNTDRVDNLHPALLVRSPGSHIHNPLPVAAQISQAKTEFNKDVPAALNTNSLIDGEVPERERARALELDPEPINAINPPSVSPDCSSSSCSSHNDKERHTSVSSTPYVSVPTRASSLAPQQTHFQRQPSPETLSRVDTPPRPHLGYASTHVEDSQFTETETVFASASNSQLRFPSPPEDQPRPLIHDGPARAPVTFAHLPASFLDNPLRPPPLRQPPDTIIGRGRAPQPTLDAHSQDPWMFRHSQHRHQESHMDHHIEKMQVYEEQPSQEQYKTTPQLQYQQQHRHSQQQQHGSQQYYPRHHHHHSQQQHNHADHQSHHTRSQQVQQLSEHSLSPSNMTQMNLEAAPERPARPVPAPAPFYVQLLPPSFSHLPHLETFSLPRESRKASEAANRKRGVSVGGRASRGRSLSLPAPGGRAAVFTPLVLQVQDDHRGRYIPLRHIPDASLPT